MEILTNNYKRNPNEKVHSLYQGVSTLGGSVVALTKKHPTEDKMQRIITPTDGLARGQGGLAAVLVLGGMETTLDEMEYILEARRQKKWTPTKTGGEISQMCQLVAERRNEQIKHYRKNPSEAPKVRKRGLYLPRGYRMEKTDTPGLKVRVHA